LNPEEIQFVIRTAFRFMPGLALSWLGCASRPQPALPPAAVAAPAVAPKPDGASRSVAQAQPALAPLPPAPTQIEPDGNDSPIDSGSGALPSAAHFERVGKAPLALQRICDLKPFAGALYAAHANAPLGSDGATITRFDPSDSARPFRVAFDWNRPGEPSKGGGAGQGFLRVRRLAERLFVPDTDPPYLGFWMSKTGTEGFVFISDAQGQFAPARLPGHLPPLAPGADKPGAGLIPNALHVLDVISFRSHYYASTGSVPPGGQPNGDHAPAALHVANEGLTRWEYALGYPEKNTGNVWRFTFLVRFQDRLYAGLQDYYGREQHDYVYFEQGPGETQLALASIHPVRATEYGAAQTYRWYADGGKLYWIGAGRGEAVQLRVTENGRDWRVVALPPDAGAPTDIVRYRGSLVVLTEWALLELQGRETSVIAAVTDKRSPFELSDFFCAAPLAVYKNELYAGGQRDGALYRVVAD
jgi:hypothetical protein